MVIQTFGSIAIAFDVAFNVITEASAFQILNAQLLSVNFRYQPASGSIGRVNDNVTRGMAVAEPFPEGTMFQRGYPNQIIVKNQLFTVVNGKFSGNVLNGHITDFYTRT